MAERYKLKIPTLKLTIHNIPKRANHVILNEVSYPYTEDPNPNTGYTYIQVTGEQLRFVLAALTPHNLHPTVMPHRTPPRQPINLDTLAAKDAEIARLNALLAGHEALTATLEVLKTDLDAALILLNAT